MHQDRLNEGKEIMHKNIAIYKSMMDKILGE